MRVRPGPPDPSLLAPGGRPPAPGALVLVQALLNTANPEFENDGLGDVPRAAAWLARHGLPGGDGLDDAGAGRARALRQALRTSLLGDDAEAVAAADAELDAAAVRARLTLVFAGGGSRLVPGAEGLDAALGAVLVALHAGREDGTAERLKACRACDFVFYDQSRNRSGAWCAMAVCGNRVKTRRYRARAG